MNWQTFEPSTITYRHHLPFCSPCSFHIFSPVDQIDLVHELVMLEFILHLGHALHALGILEAVGGRPNM
jgi:hypothetical protein